MKVNKPLYKKNMLRLWELLDDIRKFWEVNDNTIQNEYNIRYNWERTQYILNEACKKSFNHYYSSRLWFVVKSTKRRLRKKNALLMDLVNKLETKQELHFLDFYINYKLLCLK